MKNKIVLILFLLIFLIHSEQNSFAQYSQRDSLALVDLYNSTNGDNWTRKDNWLQGTLNTWYGIEVEHPVFGGLVWRIILNNNNLIGTIPSSIGNLTELTDLEFENSQLSGGIPSSINNLKKLTALGLSLNQLSGTIPAFLFSLDQLELINLSYNQFTGSIPAQINNMPQMQYLLLQGNELTGTIPPQISNIPNLIMLDLSQNQLSGAIPSEIGSLSLLETLHLYSNMFETVTTSLTSLHNLYFLTLNHNKLTNLPNLSLLAPPGGALQGFYVYNNALTFEDIEPNVGHFPAFNYSPQADSVGMEIDATIAIGDPITMRADVGGNYNVYQWTKNGTDIQGASNSDFTIDHVKVEDGGTYVCKITNTLATDLTLYTRPLTLNKGVIKPLKDSLFTAEEQDTINGSLNAQRVNINLSVDAGDGLYQVNRGQH